MAARDKFVAEAVGADDDTGLEPHAVAQRAGRGDDAARHDEAALADAGVELTDIGGQLLRLVARALQAGGARR